MVKIFLDTADIECIKHWQATSIIDGITTNPSNLSKEMTDPIKRVKEILEICGNGHVSIEITEKDPKKIYEQALEIAQLKSNAVVKIPCYIDYFETINRLVKEGIKINVTLVFTAIQALIMAKLGVLYISPFVGRLEDNHYDGINLICEIKHLFSMHKIKTEILAASLRTVYHVHEAIMAGADAITIPPIVCQKMVDSQLTTDGIEKFDLDWKRLGITKFP
jgi:transaldolase